MEQPFNQEDFDKSIKTLMKELLSSQGLEWKKDLVDGYPKITINTNLAMVQLKASGCEYIFLMSYEGAKPIYLLKKTATEDFDIRRIHGYHLYIRYGKIQSNGYYPVEVAIAKNEMNDKVLTIFGKEDLIGFIEDVAKDLRSLGFVVVEDRE